jgi:hypothetical protein
VAVAVGWRLEIGSVGGGEHWHQETFPSEIDVDVVCDMPGFVLCFDDLFGVEIMVSSMQYFRHR